MQRPSVPKAEVVQAGVQRAAQAAAKATTDVLNMQDVARAAVQWSSRVVTRRPSRASRSSSQDEKGGIGHYAAEARDLFHYTYQDLKQAGRDLYQEVTSDVLDFSPLPSDFDYSYALISYIWTVMIMTAKTVGHRVARLNAVESGLESVFYKPTAAFLLYVLLPIYTGLINQKYSEKQLSLNGRRIVILGLAFVYGLLGEHIWIHWVHSTNSAPYYYYPAVIGLTLQLLGPQLGADRRWLLGSCISAAVVLSVGIAVYMNVLTVGYVGATVISALSSLLNLQLLISDLRKHGSDERMMIVGHYRALIVSAYSHAILTVLCAKYDKQAINESDAAVE